MEQRFGKRKIEDEEKCGNKRIQSLNEDSNIKESDSSEEENVFSGEEKDEYSTGEENNSSEEEEKVSTEESMKEKVDKQKADLEKQMNDEISKKEKANRENQDLVKKIFQLEKQISNEKEKNEGRFLELEKPLNDERLMKEASQKEKCEVLNFLEIQVTCPVCLLIPRTKRIPICRNGHSTCETCKRTNCPVCRTKMEEETYSPLTLNIIDLLAVPCIFMDQGCTIKLKKKEIVEHENEECRYRELMCPGCEKKIQAWKLPDHFKICLQLSCQEKSLHMELDKTQYEWFITSKSDFIESVVYKLETSENSKLVFYIRHYCGEKTKETFNYKIKISDKMNKLSRSMSGVCTPLNLDIKDASSNGYTLDISAKAMRSMFFLPKPNTEKSRQYGWNIEFRLFKSDS